MQKRLNISLSEDDDREIKSKAAAKGQSVSEFIRSKSLAPPSTEEVHGAEIEGIIERYNLQGSTPTWVLGRLLRDFEASFEAAVFVYGNFPGNRTLQYKLFKKFENESDFDISAKRQYAEQYSQNLEGWLLDREFDGDSLTKEEAEFLELRGKGKKAWSEHKYLQSTIEALLEEAIERKLIKRTPTLTRAMKELAPGEMKELLHRVHRRQIKGKEFQERLAQRLREVDEFDLMSLRTEYGE